MEDNTLDFFDLDGYESPEPAVEPADEPIDPVDTDPIEDPVEPTDPVEPDEVTDTDEEDDALKLNYEYLKGLGALYLPDDYQFKATEKGFEEAVKASNENLQKALFDGMFEDMPEEGKALLSYYANGGTNVKEFISVHARPDYTKVDLDDETAQEAIVREGLKRTTKFSDAKIEREIEALPLDLEKPLKKIKQILSDLILKKKHHLQKGQKQMQQSSKKLLRLKLLNSLKQLKV